MVNSKRHRKHLELQERYEQVSDCLTALLDDYRCLQEELRYLKGYISYKNLEDEFCYFQKNAHEEYDKNLPFPYLTL